MIHVSFDNTPEDLAAIAAIVFNLQQQHATATAVAAVTASAAPQVAAWYGHLGDGSRSFWQLVAQHALTHRTWTFDDLATASGTDKETLRSYHRNSYRAIKDEGAPDPMPGDWEGSYNVYYMADAVRDAILQLTAA
jgi:hypothetical protein